MAKPGRLRAALLAGAGWLALACLLLAALGAGGARYLVCYLPSHQPLIESYLAARGMDEASLGRVATDCQARDPRIRVAGLRLAAAGQPALEIDSLDIKMDWLRSLAHLAPIASEVEADGLRVALATQDGRLHLRGWTGAPGTGISLGYLLDSLAQIQRLHLSGMDIAISNQGRAFHIRTEEALPLLIQQAEGERQVSVQPRIIFTAPGGGETVQKVSLTGQYQGDPRSPSFAAALYLDLPVLNLAALLPPRARLASATLAARLWLTAEPGKAEAGATLKVANVKALKDGAQASLLDSAEASLAYAGASLTQGTLALPALALAAGGAEYRLEGLRLALEGKPGQRLADIALAASLPALALGSLGQIASHLAEAGYVPEPVGEALVQVNPQGRLTDLLLRSQLDGSAARLVANAEDLAISSHQGVPGITAINGFLSASPEAGYFELDNQAFELHLANLFEDPWPFASGRGRLRYQATPDAYILISDLGEFHDHTGGKAWIKILLNLAQAPERRTWAMALGISEVPLTRVHLFLPTTIKPSGRRWIGERLEAGQAWESALLMHGALSRESPWGQKTLGGYFKVRDARLRYHDDWPPVESLAATVSMTSHFVGADDATGRVLGSELVTGAFLLPIEDRKVHRVTVDALSRGPLGDILHLLRTTPLAQLTNDMAADWSGKGELEATLALGVPISPESPPLSVTVDSDFAGLDLAMNNYRLEMTDLAGALRYTDAQGLTSPGFKGRLFGHPVTGSIEGQRDGKAGETIVHVQGQVDMPALRAWTGQPLLSQAFGQAQYDAAVHIPFGAAQNPPAYLEAQSNLTGVTLVLPAPMTKLTAESVAPFRYRQVFHPDGHLVDFTLQDQLHAAFKLKDGLMQGGNFHLGGSAPPEVPAYDDIQVTGSIGRLRYEAWANVVKILTAVEGEEFDANLRRRFGALNLTIGELAFFGAEFRDLALTATREADRWAARIDHELVAGTLALPDDAPLNVALDYLKFAAPETDEAGEANEAETETAEAPDPLAKVDPASLGDLDFSIDSLQLGKEDYGSWAFECRIQGDAAVFQELQAESRGISILPGAQVEWQGAQTGFKGQVYIADMGLALGQFGLASSIEGEEFALEADVQWPGSPAKFDFLAASGALRLIAGNGRFVQAAGGGPLKLLGIFDFAQLARRFRLDFSDLVTKGYAFNDIKGAVLLDGGEVQVTDPILIDSSSSTVKVGGRLSLRTREIDSDMVVILPLGKSLPWYAAYSAILTGPLAGAGVILARKLFGKQIDAISSAKYHITGTMDEPEIKFVSIFNASVRDQEAAEAEAEAGAEAEKEQP